MMKGRSFVADPCVPPKFSSRGERRDFFHSLFKIIIVVSALSVVPAAVHADQMRLVSREEGNEVEVLEEQESSFIVKVPKSEIELIKRQTPAEIKLWKEKKILWKDEGDYLVISLPKERILPPPAVAPAEGPLPYATASSLQEGLDATGAKGQSSAIGLLAGSVTGRVFKNGYPVEGCRVRLSVIEGPTASLTRLLGAKSAKESAPARISTTTASNGVYLFEEVPIGDYDIAWLPPGSKHWLGWLSDKPDVTVRAGETTQQGDIHL